MILGKYIIEFEKVFVEYVGIKYVIVVNSGFFGLEIILCLKKVEGIIVLVFININFVIIVLVIWV